MKKTIIILIVIILLISIVIAEDKISNIAVKETDDYKVYDIKVNDKDATLFEIKKDKEISAVKLITDFIEMKKEKEKTKVNSD